MDYYRALVSLAVKRHMSTSRVSAERMANDLAISKATFYAKLAGHRLWTLDTVTRQIR